MYYKTLLMVFICITISMVKGKQILEVEKKEGYDLHTLKKLEEVRTNTSSSPKLSTSSIATSKAVNQGRSNQFAICRQSGICLGRVIVCPKYCFSSNAIPTKTTKMYDNEVLNTNNYYYYYYYDDGQPPSGPGSPGSPGGHGGSPGSPGGGFGGGHGGAPGSPGSPGGGFGGGRGGAPGSPGSPSGGGRGGNGGGIGGGKGGPGGLVPPPGPSGSFRRGRSGSIGSGNGCKYDCLTSCRAFCA